MNPAAPVTSILRIVIYSLGHFPSSREWFGNQISDQWRDLGDGRDPIRPRRRKRGLRHSVNDGALAVLDDRRPARDADAPQSLSAVPAHACEHNTYRGAAE